MVFVLPMLFMPVSSTLQAGLERIFDNHMCWPKCESGLEDMGISKEDDKCLKYYTMCLGACLMNKISDESRTVLEMKWQRECVDGAGQWMPMGHNCGRTDAFKVRVDDCDSFVTMVLDAQSIEENLPYYEHDESDYVEQEHDYVHDEADYVGDESDYEEPDYII